MPLRTATRHLRDALPELIELRHDLHRHPELGFAELRTQRVVMDWLERCGYRPRPCAETGVVADLRPELGAPRLALRADLDALPIDEQTDLPYRSAHPGVAHKCGHDGHAAILLGVASALAAARAEVGANVRLLFQPAEEGVRGGGARVMVEEGALDGVGAVFGLHTWPGFPRGEVRVAAGPVMADVRNLTIVLRGRGGHGSQPQRCRDPIVAGAAVVAALQGVIARGLDHAGGAVLTIGSFKAGEANNVIPSRAVLTGTLRTLDDALRADLLARVRAAVDGVAAAHGVAAELEVDSGYPVLVNDPGCAEAVAAAAARVVGPERVGADGLPLAASEDFAFLARRVPGAFFFLGAGDPVGETPACHHPDFDFDDGLLELGARCFLELVAAYPGSP